MVNLNLSPEEEFILARREAKKQKAIRDLEEAAHRLEEFGYEVKIWANKVN